MQGIILAGGSGTRLQPLTIATSKQLLPVYDKPMIYYPISTLMLSGIRNMSIITTPHESEQFRRLLGDGSQWGINISFFIQDSPKGIAQAFLITEERIQGHSCALILGDNIFYGGGLGESLASMQQVDGATIFAHQVSDPQNYGVVEFDEAGLVKSLEEKPSNPKSNFAVPGLYFYDSNVVDMSRSLSPSDRGELEITDLNNEYLKLGKLSVIKLHRGTAWLDTGTIDSLISAGEFVKVIQQRQGTHIGSPDEIAWRKNWISSEQLEQQADRYRNSGYGQYLRDLIHRG